jgi:MinD-like ATPase involved in chromosome partitioning or flagellar assembly
VEGFQIAVIDADNKAPSLHQLLQLDEAELSYSLADYLDKSLDVHQIAYDVTAKLKLASRGKLYYVQANTKQEQTTQQIQGVQYAEWLNTGCQQLIDNLKLDAVLIDTQPGLEQDTLIPLTISDVVVIILRHDQRDYQGTGVAVDIIQRLNVPQVLLMVNEAPKIFDVDDLTAQLEATFNYKVGAILPYIEEIVTLANKDIFALHYPHHFATLQLKHVALQLMT